MFLRIRDLLFVVTLAVLCAIPVRMAAQTTTAEVVGTIMDSSGGILPGASVTIKNVQTGAVRTMETNSSGSYGFAFLPVGDYTVMVEISGFKTFTTSGLSIENAYFSVPEI